MTHWLTLFSTAIFLTSCVPGLAQTPPRVAEPVGPVFEATAQNGNWALRIPGCTRDTQKQVVCAITVRSLAQSNLSLTLPLLEHYLVAPTGFRYQGYAVVEGGRPGANSITFDLGRGQTSNIRLVFPNVPESVAFVPYLSMAGFEFRGLPIANNPIAAQPSAPAPSAAANDPGVLHEEVFEDVKLRFLSCTADSQNQRIRCAFEVVAPENRDSKLFVSALDVVDMNGNIYSTSTCGSVTLGNRDGCDYTLIAGLTVRGNAVYRWDSGSDRVARLRLDLYVNGKNKQIVVRNVPVTR